MKPGRAGERAAWSAWRGEDVVASRRLHGAFPACCALQGSDPGGFLSRWQEALCFHSNASFGFQLQSREALENNKLELMQRSPS